MKSKQLWFALVVAAYGCIAMTTAFAQTPFGGYTSGQPNIPCATSTSTSANCTSAQFAQAGLIQSNSPTAQGIVSPTGTDFPLTETNTSQAIVSLFAPNLRCVGPGYDYGNNGTSAEGWGGCSIEQSSFLANSAGINMMYGATYEKAAIGDGFWQYVYTNSFGGFVDASGEQTGGIVEHIQSSGG